MAERFLIEARNGAVAVEDGVIIDPSGRFDSVLRFPEAEVRPGLINAHDHLHRNHYGRLGAPPYRDAEAWARDVEKRCRREIESGRRLRRREALLLGAWKNLFAGVTTIVHHDPWEPDFDRAFPLRVVRIPCGEARSVDRELAKRQPERPYSLHVAEGISDAAAREFDRILGLGLLGPQLLAVHGVALGPAAIARFRESGAALIWCPSSNLFLYGRTAPACLLARGVDLLLGSDSLLSAAGNLLDELRLARSLALVTDERLEEAVGEVAARRLGLPEPALRPGCPADLVLLRRPLLEAAVEDVELVVAGGTIRVAAPRCVPELGPWAERGRLMTVGGIMRWVDGTAPQPGPAAGPGLIHKMNHVPVGTPLSLHSSEGRRGFRR